MKKSELYKIRYQIYRDLGYSAKEARELRSKALDVSPLSLDKKTGKVTKGKAYRSIRDSMTGPKDIDKFKNVNDTYGHYSGDQVLKDIGRIILKNIRSTDIGFRIGGDEFAIIFKGATKAGSTNPLLSPKS
jgi:hypothetical protein